MECPYCRQRMETGTLRFHRDVPVFVGENDKVKNWERALGGIGMLTGVRRRFASNDMEAHFCPSCRKMILDTDIVK